MGISCPFENKISLNGKPNVSYMISNGDDIVIVPNHAMEVFELLDSENYSIIKTEGSLNDDTIAESYSIKESKITYKKEANRYYICDSAYVGCSMLILIVGCALMWITILFTVNDKFYQ